MNRRPLLPLIIVIQFFLYEPSTITCTEIKYQIPDKFIVISPPKAGTHLILKTIELLLGPFKVIYNPENAPQNEEYIKQFTNLYPKSIEQLLNQNKFYINGGHLICNNNNRNLIEKNKLKCILIQRDIRDQLISYVYYLEKFLEDFITNNPTSPIPHIVQYMISLPLEKRINSYLENNPDNYFFSSDSQIQWRKYPYVLSIKYEDLVGPKGGGSKEKQIKAINSIVEFLNLQTSKQHVQIVADSIFGDTSTFRKGQIGSWKQHFSEKQKKIFKKAILFGEMTGAELLIDLGYEKNDKW